MLFRSTEVTVDLATRQVRCADVIVPMQVDDYTRWRLMEGLDDIGLTLQHEAGITEFEEHRAGWRPTTLPAKHLPNVEVRPARPVVPHGDDALV